MSSGVMNVVAFVQQVRRRLYVDVIGRRNDSVAPAPDNAQENVLKYVPWYEITQLNFLDLQRAEEGQKIKIFIF
jgi:hypothetical protein